MHRRISLVLIIFFLCASMVFIVKGIFAQTALTRGEMISDGEVYVVSSSGRWMPVPEVYPMLEKTAVKTKKGSVSLFYTSGSQIDLFESSKVVIDNGDPPYTVQLLEGELDIKTSPHDSFVLKNGSSEILLNDNSGMVQKEGDRASEGFLGSVSLRNKGLFVTSILGAALITLNDSETKSIPSGSSIYIESDNDGNYTTYEPAGKSIERHKKKRKKKKHHKKCKKKKHASPFNFCDDSDSDSDDSDDGDDHDD